MKIELKDDWLGHKAGYVMTVNEQTGIALVDRGVAKVITETPPSGHVTCTRCGAFVKLLKAAKAVKSKKEEVKNDEAKEPESEAA